MNVHVRRDVGERDPPQSRATRERRTHRKASMTTLPFTDWMGSITTATARSVSCSNDCCVFMSTPESQHPNPGWEWYQPTTISGRPVCFNMSNIFAWNTGSTASTETPVPRTRRREGLKNLTVPFDCQFVHHSAYSLWAGVRVMSCHERPPGMTNLIPGDL